MRPGSAARLPGSPVILLLVTILVTQIGLQAARPLVSYRTISLGGEGLAIGLAAAAFAGLSIVAAIPLGRYTDRTGRTTEVLAVGALLSVLGAVLLAIAPTLALAAGASATLGLAHVLLMVGGQGHVARGSSDRELDRNFGLFTAAVAGGQLLGPLVAGVSIGASEAVTVSGTTRAGTYAALIGVASLPCAGLLWWSAGRQRAVPARRATESAPTLATAAILRRRGIPNALFVSLALLGAVDLLTAYLPLVGEERGITPAVVGALLALRAGASLVARLALGVMADRWPRHVLVLVSAAGAGLAMVVVALPGAGATQMAVALLVGGFLLGIGQPLTMTSVVRGVPASARGAALALRLVTNRAGQVVLPALAALASGLLGSAAALWFVSGLLLLAGASSAGSPETGREPDEPGP